MEYDYKLGKERIISILNQNDEINEVEKVPKTESEFTYGNGILSWVTSIFVDIRGSKDLYKNEQKKDVAKIIRSFTSEVIAILSDDDLQREIGIEGDCVYGIYSTPQKNDVYNIAEKTFYINTFIRMLNILLKDNGLKTIEVGIGMATAKELIIKAGRKGSGINSKIWIGDAVSKAAYYSDLGKKKYSNRLVYSKVAYDNFINILCDNNKGKNPKSWFTFDTYENIYHASIIKTEFDDWIENGMN